MQQCRKCKVNVEGHKQRCPLCQSQLTGQYGEELFPEHAQPKYSSNFLIRIISFIAICAAVICISTDYMLSGGFSWSIISLGGIICAWLTATVGITYRKKILKNITWQLFLITALSVIWDRYTGWRGWSVDFVLPCSCIVAMASVIVVSKVLKKKPGEYMLYLIIGGFYGFLPLICLIAGLVHIRYPSVICTGISIIFMAALFIFRGKTTKDEIERRFHI